MGACPSVARGRAGGWANRPKEADADVVCDEPVARDERVRAAGDGARRASWKTGEPAGRDRAEDEPPVAELERDAGRDLVVDACHQRPGEMGLRAAREGAARRPRRRVSGAGRGEAGKGIDRKAGAGADKGRYSPESRQVDISIEEPDRRRDVAANRGVTPGEGGRGRSVQGGSGCESGRSEEHTSEL